MENKSVQASVSAQSLLHSGTSFGLRRTASAILRNPAGLAGFVILFLIVLLSLTSPLLFPLDTASDARSILLKPGGEHLLGTDHLGRDIWAQIANGGRELLMLSLITASIAIFIGIVLGAFAALTGGRFDGILLFLADVWLSVPRLPLLVVISGFLELSSLTLALILALLSWAGIFRVIRAEVLSLKERDYIEAALMLDLGRMHIIFREILPNMAGFIAVNFTLLMRASIYAQVGLVFLGLLPLEQNWGVMINLAWNQGVLYNPDAIWFLLAPTIMISLLILSLVWCGKALEELFNPSLRKE